jgi:hypothetical protein
MRSVARWVGVGWLIAWHASACWAIGPMGFSDPPPKPLNPPQRQTTPSSDESGTPPIPTTDMSMIAPQADGSCGCQSCGCQTCGKHKLGSRLKSGIFCNMPQHYAYPSPWDRYYYFRPYQYFQVTQLQQTVAGWGQDPRNISDNRFFQGIYDEVAPSGEQDPGKPATAPLAKPKPEPVPVPEPQPVKPTEQGRQGPKLGQPRLKITQQETPLEAAP